MLNLPAWALPALVGLGLAASTGLRAFLPLLLLALVVRSGLLGIELKPEVEWLVSDTAILALAIASGVEMLGDKIPWVDRMLTVLGYVVRPLAGVIAVYAIFSGFDPLIAAVAALAIGAPAALTFNALQAGDRLKRAPKDRPDDKLAGLSNAAVSLILDLLAIVAVMTAFTVPSLTPILVALMLGAVWWVARRWARRSREYRAARRRSPLDLSTQPS